MKYRPEIDGLRALAVLPVIFFHAGFRAFSGGYVGVDVFFVISGYLITALILSEERTGAFTIAGFYERRIRRILPGLFAVMFACLPFVWWLMLPSEVKEFSKSVMAVLVFASNILFWREGGYFETPGAFKPLLHTWSLAVEEQYYLLFPLLLLAMLRFARRWIGLLFAAAAIASLAAAQWSSHNHPPAAFYLLPTRGWELLLGAYVAWYFFKAPPTTLAARQRASPANQIGSLSGLGLIAAAVVAYDRDIPYPGLYALAPTCGTALLILCANQDTWVGKLLKTRILVGVGLLSYSAYLWHQPLFAFARISSQSELGTGLALLLALASIGCAYLSWRFIEKPFRKKSLLNRRQVLGATGLAGASLLAVALIGYQTDGLARRYPEHDRALAGLDVYQAGVYVEKRFVDLELKPFDSSGRKKILIVGDSFGQDLVNAVFEGDLASRVQLSTHWIPTQCGNLFLGEEFLGQIAEDRRAICRNSGWYTGAKLRQLMSQADAIWIASRWTPWEAQLLPQSVRRLTAEFHAPVLVFGPKNLGRYTIRQLLALPEAQRLSYRNPILESQIEINASMKASIPAGNYLDVSELLCGSAATCPLFTEDGQLVSFDGAHLTQDGARFLGGRLSRELASRGIVGRTGLDRMPQLALGVPGEDARTESGDRLGAAGDIAGIGAGKRN